MLTHGSLFTGYGGLDLAIEQWYDAETIWVSENDPDASKVIERRKPGIPNLGDITKIDWANVQSVNILSGGSPCQDVSTAGRVRLGMKEGTRSNLWVAMREAIKHLQPDLVVWENVRGVVSAQAHSDLESEHGHVGGPYIRALGRVLGDLTALGYDCEWRNVRASDAGAPHRRERIFLLAERRHPDARRIRRGRGGLDPWHSHQSQIVLATWAKAISLGLPATRQTVAFSAPMRDVFGLGGHSWPTCTSAGRSCRARRSAPSTTVLRMAHGFTGRLGDRSQHRH